MKIRYCTTKDKKGNNKLVELHVEETDEKNPEAVREVCGSLEVKYRGFPASHKPDFAFVDHTFYVNGSLLEKCGITTDCEVSAVVVYLGNNRWEVVDMTLLNE